MVKKIISTILVLFMVFAIPSSIYAQNNSVSATGNIAVTTTSLEVGVNASVDTQVEIEDNLTEEDSQVLSDNYGAQIRLLQLNKSLSAQIAGANTIIDNLIAENISSNITDKLSIIVAKMNDLTINISNFDLNQSADILAKEFILIKSESIDLSRQFRTIIRSNIDKKTLKTLKQKYLEKKREILAKKNKNIAKLKDKFNAKIIENKLKKFGKNNPILIEEVKSGKITTKEALKQLRFEFRNLPPQEKKKIIQEIKENKKKLSIQQKERIREFKKEIIQKINKNRNELNSEDIKQLKQRYFKYLQERKKLRKKIKTEIKIGNTKISKKEIEMAKKYIQEHKNLNKEDLEKLKQKYLQNQKIRKKSSINIKGDVKVNIKMNSTSDSESGSTTASAGMTVE